MIKNKKIAGSGQVAFGGAYHFLNSDGQALCGVHHIDDRLYCDRWIGQDGNQRVIEQVTCKKCQKRARDSLFKKRFR